MALTILSVFSVGALMSVGGSTVTEAKCQGVDCVSQEISTNPDYTTGQNKSVGSLASVIVSTLLYFIGVVAIVMLIYGGILYTISSGDAAKAKKAKDTILYAVIGLVIAVLAYAIFNFVVKAII